LRPEKYAHTARLTCLQDYDPNRIPVIFVHGLQDTPASWAPMINTLREDPDIRRRYQFWVFSYPSGYPYPYSAALLRKELDSVDRAFPNHKGIVLVGHSMGGMVSRLMITDVGDKLWRVLLWQIACRNQHPKFDQGAARGITHFQPSTRSASDNLHLFAASRCQHGEQLDRTHWLDAGEASGFPGQHSDVDSDRRCDVESNRYAA